MVIGLGRAWISGMTLACARHPASHDRAFRGEASPVPGGGHGDPTSVSKHVIECKVVRPGLGKESVILAGIEQTGQYTDKCGAESGHCGDS